MEVKKVTLNLPSFEKIDIKEFEGILEKVLRDLFPNGELHKLKTKAPEMTIPYYEAKIAERNRVSPEFINNTLAALWAIHPASVISILLRAIAMEMDNNYPDHISDAEEIWSVDDLDGEIFLVDKSLYKNINYRNLPAFRCEDDAKGACIILKPLFKSLYGRK